MLSTSRNQQQEAILELTKASKVIVEGINQTYQAFQDLSLQIFPGERLGIFGVNGYEAKTLLACLSGVEPLDRGRLEQRGSVSWPLGSNDAFSAKLTGYVNARFAAEVYSKPGCIDEDMRLIQKLTGVDDDTLHQPLGDWPSSLRDALKLAVSLAFDFDVITVGRISSGWDHRCVLPLSTRIRDCFERRIDGRTLLVSANGQSNLALDYCDEGLAIVNGELAYRGDPDICLQLVREESKRQRSLRRERVDKRKAKAMGVDTSEDGPSTTDEADTDSGDF
jgi:ABC-type polysaccharide/polyol phosphate transport system ATPase subunit